MTKSAGVASFSQSQIQHVETDSVHNRGPQQACGNLVESMQSECSYASTTVIGAVGSLPVAIKELQELRYKR